MIGLTRRALLVRTGWLAAGSTVVSSCAWIPVLPTFGDPDLDDACLWVQALPDGRIRFYCPKSEMGQGVVTGLTQIVAEELNVELSEIESVAPDTSQIPPAKMTVGSESIEETFGPLSTAAALLRETLRARAATRLGVSPADVLDAVAGFSAPDGAPVRYADLVADEAEVVRADPGGASSVRRYSLERDTTRCRQIGKSPRPVGIEAIVTGREVYSRDVAVPGMLHGRVVRAPRLRARLGAVDPSAARAVAGVRRVAVDRDRSRVGIVAETPFVLDSAAAALEIEWREGEQRSQSDLDRELDVDRAIEAGNFEHTLVHDGDPHEAADRAIARLSARYDTSFMAHAAMEPRSGLVSVSEERVDVWTGSQDPWYMRSVVARTTGRSARDVIVHNVRMGGAFGGRMLCQATEEAAWLSAGIGEPVRVQWSREDEFQANYFQPPFSHRIDAGVDADGRISHWLHDYTAGPILMTSTMIPDHLHWLVDRFKDPGTHQNVVPRYTVPDMRIRYSDIRLPVPTGAWRGLGAAPNTTPVEGVMDELAELAGADPIEFRLRHTDDPRLQGVLHRVADLSGWREPGATGRARGVAATHYVGKTYVAVVVEVDASSGQIRPTRAWCAFDCGRVINPDQVKAQVEGCIHWGISMALLERSELDAGAIASHNFHDYPVLRHDLAPDVDVALIERPGDPPVGAGEAAIAPTPAALLNAVYAATGERRRRLPLRLDS